MRVISGIAKGRRLHVPSTNDVRPTTDRVREALFSHLGNRVSGAAVLDLFAGSGALGIESLSRGANSATFIERAAKTFACLKKNVSELGFEQRSVCRQCDGVGWLNTLKDTGQVFDLIFLDPPYDGSCLHDALRRIAEIRCLSAEGLIVAEHRANASPEELIPEKQLQILRTRQYGKTAITTMEWTSPELER